MLTGFIISEFIISEFNNARLCKGDNPCSLFGAFCVPQFYFEIFDRYFYSF